MPYNIVYRFGKFYVIDAMNGKEVNSAPPHRKILTGANDVADFMDMLWRNAGREMPNATYDRWFATAVEAQNHPGVEMRIVTASDEPAPTSPPPSEQMVRLKEYRDLKERVKRIDKYASGLEAMMKIFIEAGGDERSGLSMSLQREITAVRAEQERSEERMAMLENRYHTNVERLF